MRVFREDGRCAGCCLEDDNVGVELGLDIGRVGDEGELSLDDVRASSSSGGSSSRESSSSSGYDQPPRRRARIEEACGLSHRRAPVKQEEGLF